MYRFYRMKSKISKIARVNEKIKWMFFYSKLLVASALARVSVEPMCLRRVAWGRGAAGRTLSGAQCSEDEEEQEEQQQDVGRHCHCAAVWPLLHWAPLRHTTHCTASKNHGAEAQEHRSAPAPPPPTPGFEVSACCDGDTSCFHCSTSSKRLVQSLKVFTHDFRSSQ